MTKRSTRAFTLVELLVVISIIALLVGLLLPAIGRARKNAQQVKCGAQVRAIHQGLVAFAQNNKESYPFPSTLDRRHQTEPNYGGNAVGAKNRTGSIWSILIFNKIVPEPEVFVSPSEVNPFIRPISMDRAGKNGAYEFQTVRPGSNSDGGVANTVNPDLAIWDPSFKGAPVPVDDRAPQTLDSDVSGDTVGNNSYAHGALRGVEYEQRWGTIFSLATIPVIGNRGPVYKFASELPESPEDWELEDGGNAAQGTDSNTLRIHGGKSSWEGNVGYNDGHVSFENGCCPEEFVIRDGSKTYPDNIFVSEILTSTESEYRKDNFMFVWKQGLTLNPNRQDQQFAFLPQASRNFMWADGLE